MGVNDHRKIWQIATSDGAAECIDAFAESFSQSVGVLRSASWDVRKDAREAAATYIGRTGLGSMANSHGQGARVVLRVVASESGSTVCHLKLAEHTTRGPFVEDVGIIRKYMQNALRHMGQTLRDSSVQAL